MERESANSAAVGTLDKARVCSDKCWSKCHWQIWTQRKMLVLPSEVKPECRERLAGYIELAKCKEKENQSRREHQSRDVRIGAAVPRLAGYPNHSCNCSRPLMAAAAMLTNV